MEKVKLTKTEEKILEAWVESFGLRPPTYSEVAKKLGISRETVFEYVQKLKKKGLLTKKGYPVVAITSLKGLI